MGLLAVAVSSHDPAHLAASEGLRLAVFSADVTPPIGSPVAYAPVRSVTDPLFAKGLVLLGADDPIVLFSLDARPADYGRMARRIVEAAEAGDPLGSRLMDEGAGYIRAALAVLGWTRGERLCLTGGLGPAYARWMGETATAPRGSALDGALLLAARAAEAAPC